MVLTALNAINYLNYLFQTLHFYRRQNNVLNPRRQNTVGRILNLIQLLYNFAKWILNRWRRRRRNLLTPNVLIKLLRQYRCRRHYMDFWNNLEQNWTDFFWLTGETPQSLQLLVNSLHTIRYGIIGRRIRLGRRPALSFRNQVKYI